MLLRRGAGAATRGVREALAPAAARPYHKNARAATPPRCARGALTRATPQVVDHYESPRNVGSFDKADPNVGTGLVGAPACGDVMKFQIKARGGGDGRAARAWRTLTPPPRFHHAPQVDADGNITDSCFKTFGCGSAIASSSVATEWVKGRSIESASDIKNTDIAKHLSLPPVKLHCSMLAEDAIKVCPLRNALCRALHSPATRARRL